MTHDAKISRFLRARGAPGPMVRFTCFARGLQNRPNWHPGTVMLDSKENLLFTTLSPCFIGAEDIKISMFWVSKINNSSTGPPAVAMPWYRVTHTPANRATQTP